MSAEPHRYLVALGSNVRHHRCGAPPAVLRCAVAELARHRIVVDRLSPIVDAEPLGPSKRRFANAAAIVRTGRDPPALLSELKRIERAFGRRRGRRWGARVLDLDLILWSGGRWRSRELAVPHRAFRLRAFVLVPASRIAPRWRDPETGLTLAQLAARLTRPRPAPNRRAGSGP